MPYNVLRDTHLANAWADLFDLFRQKLCVLEDLNDRTKPGADTKNTSHSIDWWEGSDSENVEGKESSMDVDS